MIIIIAIVAAAIYLYGVGSNQFGEPLSYLLTEEQDTQVRDLQELSDSDEPSDIEAELDSTNFDNLDEGVDEVDQALGDI